MKVSGKISEKTGVAPNLEIQPAEVVFIDDKPENVEAAKSVGIQAAVYDLADTSTSLAGVLAGFGVAV